MTITAARLRMLAILPALAAVALGCGCDQSDDDDDSQDDDDDDDDAPQAGGNPVIWIEPTAWDDFQMAEHYVEQATFSTAHVYYESAVAKLLDDEPFNDGPCPAGTLDRARYGCTLCMITIPLKIIEGFVASWSAGDDHVAADFLIDWYREEHGLDPDQEPPRSLITDYLGELIIPLLDQGIAWIDPVLDNPDFSYDMPALRLTLFATAITIPDRAGDGRGRHGPAEAALLSFVLHLGSAAAHSLYAYNLDIEADRIDVLLQILMSGDMTQILALLRQYPDLLKLHTIESSGIDGAAALLHAKSDWIAAIDRMIDDNDDDGIYGADSEQGYDPGELPDDLHDALNLDSTAPEHSVLRVVNGTLLLNVRLNGDPLGDAGLGKIWSLLNTSALYPLYEGLSHSFYGTLPSEQNPHNGLDDDLAFGFSTAIAGSTLTDAATAFAPDALVGSKLNPNTNQNVLGQRNLVFTIIDNDATSITVDGDLSEAAKAGDPYSVGDGEIDDAPLSMGFAMSLLLSGRFPDDWDLNLLLNAPFENAPDFRDVLPLTDAGLGDPELYLLVVDRSESYDDLNSNGRFDPSADVLHDAAHVYNDFSFPADGLYQPSYLYLGEPTLGGLFIWDTGDDSYEEHDLLNWLLFGLNEWEL